MHRRSPTRVLSYVVLLLTLVALVARWVTFGNPVIGFDEQFYLLVGDRMLHGAMPFVDIFDRKPVGLFPKPPAVVPRAPGLSVTPGLSHDVFRRVSSSDLRRKTSIDAHHAVQIKADP